MLTQYCGFVAVYRFQNCTLLFKTLALLFAELNAISMYAALFTFSYSFVLMGIYNLTLLETLKIMLIHLKKLMPNCQLSKVATQTTRYRTYYVKALLLICKCNEYTGKSIVPLLLVIGPGNALLLISLLTFTLDAQVQFITVMVLQKMFLNIFIVHLIFAQLNTKLKSLAKIYLPVHDLTFKQNKLKAKKVKIKERIRNLLFFETFNTGRVYGFTYCKFGIISMLNFVKVSIYIKQIYRFCLLTFYFCIHSLSIYLFTANC